MFPLAESERPNLKGLLFYYKCIFRPKTNNLPLKKLIKSFIMIQNVRKSFLITPKQYL